MSTMHIPGFTAEASLVKTSSRYRSASASFHRNGGSVVSQIVASDFAYPGSFHYCGPGYLYSCQLGICGCHRIYLVEAPTLV